MKKYFVMLATLFTVSSTSALAANVNGCTVLLDNASNTIIKQEGECEKRYSPASSFKIPLALMGYDTGILIDEHNPAWAFKEGDRVNQDSDKQVTDPVLWEKNSVVWYSQKLTTELGMEKFQHYINQFNYGNKDLSGDEGKSNGLTEAWLSSSLQISPLEQVAFLHKMINHTLPVSAKAHIMTKAILPVFDTGNGWKVHGKTGSGKFLDVHGTPYKVRPGWFVGWAEKGNKKIVFAKLLVGGESADKSLGLAARKEFLAEFPTMVE